VHARSGPDLQSAPCWLVCVIDLSSVLYQFPRLVNAVGRISSASPQLGAAKRGQGAGIAPGRSHPAQPRLPPGPKGLPEGAKPEPANGTPEETQTQRNRQELKIRHGRPSVSLVFQLLCRLQESSAVHKLFAGVSAMILGTARNVFHGSR
jgi:hypothetical protein